MAEYVPTERDLAIRANPFVDRITPSDEECGITTDTRVNFRLSLEALEDLGPRREPLRVHSLYDPVTQKIREYATIALMTFGDEKGPTYDLAAFLVTRGMDPKLAERVSLDLVTDPHTNFGNLLFQAREAHYAGTAASNVEPHAGPVLTYSY